MDLSTGVICYFEPLKNWPWVQNIIWYFDSRPMEYQVSNPFLSQIASQVPLLWNIDPLPWYIEPPTHGISNPLPSLD